MRSHDRVVVSSRAVTATLPTSPVPMFPLPGVFLFPYQVLPLQVFEPRYKDLVRDLLDGTGRFVVATIRAGERATPETPPAVLPVAGLGEIARHEKLPDGRYLIWVLGRARVRIAETASPHRYRTVHCLPFVEVEAEPEEARDLVPRLHHAASARLQKRVRLPEDMPTSVLADLLVQAIAPPQAVLERVFAEPSIAARARLVLAEAAARGGRAGSGEEGA